MQELQREQVRKQREKERKLREKQREKERQEQRQARFSKNLANTYNTSTMQNLTTNNNIYITHKALSLICHYKTCKASRGNLITL